RGKRERLIVAVGMKRLRSTEDGSERLHGHAHDVVERLLRLQRDATGLGVESHLGARIVRLEAITHEPRIEAASGAELGDLLEQIVVRSEEEREARREVIDLQTGRSGAGHI